MKLYMHPASTISRPIVLFAAEEGIALEQQIVDLMTGANQKPDFLAINVQRWFGRRPTPASSPVRSMRARRRM